MMLYPSMAVGDIVMVHALDGTTNWLEATLLCIDLDDPTWTYLVQLVEPREMWGKAWVQASEIRPPNALASACLAA